MVTTERRTIDRQTGVISTLAFDGGNTGIKFAYAGSDETGYMPSVIKELDLDMYDVSYPTDDPNSAIVEFAGATYAVGALAAMMGGSPVFELGKPEFTPLLFMAALRGVEEFSRCPVIEQLNILVPDARRQWLENVWNPVADQIMDIQSFRVNGQEIQPQVRNVTFISEGVPAFQWAMQEGLFGEFINTPGINQMGVLDIGGGETTFKLFDSRTGQINWDAEVTLPGLNALALSIANRLKSQAGFVMTPDTSDILRCLSIKHYVYEVPGAGGVDFEQQYIDARKNWAKLILQKLAHSVTQQGVGGVVIVGGGAHHAEGLEIATQGRFVVVAEESTGINPRYINSITLSER